MVYIFIVKIFFLRSKYLFYIKVLGNEVSNIIILIINSAFNIMFNIFSLFMNINTILYL